MKTVIIAGLVAAASLVSACSGGGAGTVAAPSTTAHSVELRVTGTAQHVDVTYTNATGGVSQALNQGLPWSTAFTTSAGGAFTLTATIGADDKGKAPADGTVTVTMVRDGQAVASKSVQGGLFSVVSVTGLM